MRELWRKCKTEQALYLLLTVFSTLLLCFLVYHEYIFKTREFILNHDTYNQFLPELTDFWSSIREGHTLPMWSFSKGLGQQAWINNPGWVGDIFSWLLLLFPQKNIPDMFIWLHILKIGLSSLFFYKYLLEVGSNKKIACIFSVLYAFNGHMVYRGSFLHYSTDVVFYALILYSIELYFKKKNKFLFPISLGLYMCSRYVAYTYVVTLFLIMYIIVRTIYIDGKKIKSQFDSFKKIFPAYVLSLAIASVFLIPGIYQMLSSPRITGNNSIFLNLIKSNPFQMINSDKFIEWIARFFSGTIMGITNTSGSFQVLLEGPINYCGILSVLIVPYLFFVKTSAKRKVAVCLMSIFVIVYNVFNYARYFFGAFMGAGYKTSGYWCIVFTIIIGVFVCNNLDNQTQIVKKRLKIFCPINCIFWLGVIYYVNYKSNYMMRRAELILVIAFVIMYSLLIFFAFLCDLPRIHRTIVSITFALCIGIEIVGSVFLLINSSEIKQFEEGHGNAGVYDDGTYETIKEIEKLDSGFFRIIKDYKVFDTPHMFEINHSQMQDYNGIPFYTSMKSKSNIDFYDFYNLKYDNLLLSEFNNRNLLNSNLNVKYLLSDKDDVRLPNNYEFLFKSKTGIKVFKNHASMPIGKMFDDILLEKNIASYPSIIKDEVSNMAMIVKDETIFNQLRDKGMNVFSFAQENNVDEKILISEKFVLSDCKIYETDFPNYLSFLTTNNQTSLFFELDEAKSNSGYIINFKINSEKPGKGIIYYSDTVNDFNEGQAIYFDIKKGLDDYHLKIQDMKKLSGLRLDFIGIDNQYDIFGLEIKPNIFEYKIYSGNELFKDVIFSSVEVIENKFPERIEYKTLNQDPAILINLSQTMGNMAYKLDMDIKSNTDTLGQFYYLSTLEGYKGAEYYKINKGTKHYSFNFVNPLNIEALRIDVGDKLGQYTIENIELIGVTSQGENAIINFIENNDNAVLDINKHKDSLIEGSITTERAGVMYLSIPYDIGWHLKIDGEEKESFVVNGGMMGVYLEEGTHAVQIKYIVPGFLIGSFMSCISLGVLIVIAFNENRRRKNGKKIVSSYTGI